MRLVIVPAFAALLALTACGDTVEERAATGGIGGAVGAPPSAARSSAPEWAP